MSESIHEVANPGQPTSPLTWPQIGLQPHEFAGIFRMLAGEEREAFAEDITSRGLKQKVVVFEDKILDGRNRYLVLCEEGVFEPDDEHWRDRPDLFTEFEGTREEALDFVWSLNEQRRHDSASQRAMSAARYANLRQITQAEAAEKLGVSERQVSSAAKIIEEGTPELVQAVDEGRVPAYLGEQLVDLDEDEQREVASKPKGEASAAARQKLQDPPLVAESGPVVKPMDPARFVIFAEAMSRVAERVGIVSVGTVRLLSKACGIAGDPEGITLSPAARLAIELANRKAADWSAWADYAFRGRDLPIIEAAAGLPDDIEALTALYRETLVAYNAAMLAEDGRAEALDARLTAILFHANGDTMTGVAVNDAPQSIERDTRAPDGEVPLWGQQGRFIIEVEGVKALVQIAHDLQLYAVEFHRPFVSASGHWSVHYLAREPGASVRQHAEAALRSAISAANSKDREAHERGLAYPSEIYTLTGETQYGTPPRIMRGVELTPGDWPAGLDEKAAGALAAAWEAEERAYPKPRKRVYPHSRHGFTRIIGVGADDGLVPLADFPGTGAYLIQTWDGWRYVDDGADPGEDAVAARRQPVARPAETEAQAQYLAALAMAADQHGNHTKETAEPVLRAGFAAGVPVRQMAGDLGHKLGTVQSWTARLGLTDPNRSPIHGGEQ